MEGSNSWATLFRMILLKMSSIVGTWKLYFVLVLLPQFLWFFSSDSHTAVNCEGCSFSPLFQGSISGVKSKGEESEVDKSEGIRSGGCERSYEEQDKLTATLCSCSNKNESEIPESSFQDDYGGW